MTDGLVGFWLDSEFWPSVPRHRKSAFHRRVTLDISRRTQPPVKCLHLIFILNFTICERVLDINFGSHDPLMSYLCLVLDCYQVGSYF